MYGRKKAYLIIFLMIIYCLPGHALAKVEGLCSNCHTMHNSQGGADLYASESEHLLVGGCVGCHSHNSKSDWYELGNCKVPIVFTRDAEPSTYLAGGNFYWVQTDPAKGHNVVGVASKDDLDTAPGSLVTCVNSCHDSLADNDANAGCQGCHLHPAHHATDHENTVSGLVDSVSKGWYRFLSGCDDGGVSDRGDKAYEDGYWEATPDLGNHNEYLGSQSDVYYGFDIGYTTTAFCTGCHGDFHQNQGSTSPWKMHPSDAVIPNSGEYANAFGAGGTGTGTYDPLVPVARPSLPSSPDPSVHINTDMVQCLSCHRPHGSPYFKLMRWDYRGSPTGGSCSICHTTKD